MNTQEMKDRIRFLNQEIDEAQRRLAHAINRKRELQALNAKNKSYQRQLEKKYAAEIEALVFYLRNSKSELGDLQDILLAKA